MRRAPGPKPTGPDGGVTRQEPTRSNKGQATRPGSGGRNLNTAAVQVEQRRRAAFFRVNQRSLGGSRLADWSVSLGGAARFAARLASQTQPVSAPAGRTRIGRPTNPLRHRRFYSDSPSRAASHTRTAGPWGPQPVGSGSRGGAISRTCADVTVDVTSGGLIPRAGHDSSVVRKTSVIRTI